MEKLGNEDNKEAVIIDELAKLDTKTEVFLAEGAPFEQPAKEFVPGPYYMAAEERIPEVDEVRGSESSSSGFGATLSGLGETLNASVKRRDFVRLFGISTLASATACVQRPAEKAITYVNQPIDSVPGVATNYSSTCGECAASCGITVKTREGRPVKVEGSKEHPISQGGLCAVGQAQLQGLYHPERLKSPQLRIAGRLDSIDWDVAYDRIATAVKDTKKIGILTGGSTGSRHGFFRDVLKRMGAAETNLYTWEANPLYSTLGKAHELAFGHGDLPRFELYKAQVLVGIGSDFQDVGISPVYHTKSFARAHGFNQGRKSKFIQFESHLTLTGSKADDRLVIPTNYEVVAGLLLLKSITEHGNVRGTANDKAQAKVILDSFADKLTGAFEEIGVPKEEFDRIANELMSKPSLILAGSTANADANGTLLQLIAIISNLLIGAYGSTVFFDKGWQLNPIEPGDLKRFSVEAADLDVLFVIDSNPVFTSSASWDMKGLLQKIPTVVSIQAFPNEVDTFAKFILPNTHSLESWGDEQPVAGFWSVRQPVVRATTDCRQAEDVLLWILAKMDKSLPYRDYRAYLHQQWKPLQEVVGAKIDYDTFFQAVLRRGFVGKLDVRAEMDLKPGVGSSFHRLEWPSKGLKLTTPLDHRLLDGRVAHEPVLQEVGDSLTSIAWDTWLALNPKTMQKMGLRRNQIVRVKSANATLEVPVYPLPGLHPDAVVIPRGNGHEDDRSTISYKNGINPLVLVGRSVDPLSGHPITSGEAVQLEVTKETFQLAAMQKHNDIANRTKDIVRKVSLAKASELPREKDLDTVPDIFPQLEQAEHRWGMSIDLDRCNGCRACMVACATENNIAQIGREQVAMGRAMHWIRLDRYFAGDVDNPSLTFQPVMCQHCNHAPCEAVCPVFATTHDPEGLNAMTYNRCVGTRYCANACPYKVRRFNWWQYRWGEVNLSRRPMDRNIRATNPDVTVRSRGVMEKCTMCVQRLRDAKHHAKASERPLADGEAQTACQQTCPSDAITFGNLNDTTSRIHAARKSGRAYLLLGGEPEIGHYGLKTLPNVNYLMQVTHKEENVEEAHHE